MFYGSKFYRGQRTVVLNQSKKETVLFCLDVYIRLEKVNIWVREKSSF